MSFANIRNNRMRSFLTMLGIIIGVAAVIALVTTVSAVTSYMIGRFSSMGAGMLEVSVPGTVLKPGLTENDLAELSAIDNIASISLPAFLLPSVWFQKLLRAERFLTKSACRAGMSSISFITKDW